MVFLLDRMVKWMGWRRAGRLDLEGGQTRYVERFHALWSQGLLERFGGAQLASWKSSGEAERQRWEMERKEAEVSKSEEPLCSPSWVRTPLPAPDFWFDAEANSAVLRL